ncbi:DUF5069 domain-containing protein [Methylacidiphilum caldifontis]|uniref:DUF5069 domain-containing protein n=1 Tax=Methylacidiphilum caldifontis TaxID=2795386 RepID=A0A4Y8PGV4_9BACT|nr:DUF5069 domain-containing protein [Methylacidiphilum caldifontis]QSR88532.1 DUF5069 domain-containing protein [Methylacidiphilum caldifontis]TFE72077.1 DUF5069 domain-containing protein [Methylacidiphilum caldifontis]
MKLVPLIGSGVAGPLGVLHLPRMWLKCILAAKGMLADGYPDLGKGFDAMTMAALNLTEEETRNYIRTNLPSYIEFENWIVQKNGGKIDGAKVAAHNRAVLQYHHDEETKKAILSEAGLKDDGSLPDAVNLNAIDDYTCFHKWLKSQ